MKDYTVVPEVFCGYTTYWNA